jgi:hypothetical protein
MPLVGMEAFCRSLERALAVAYGSAELAGIWRLYVSAECPVCGIRVGGNELRALAFAPSAELASAKIGRMRLGFCARQGCEAWHYAMHFWSQEGIDWARMLEAAERQEVGSSANASERQWFTALRTLTRGHAGRVAAMASVVLALWLAREFYLGGRIPFLREPEKFSAETTTVDDNTWSAPMDASEGSTR